MGKLFVQKCALTPREEYEQKYKTARMTVLFVLIFTVLNLVLLLSNADVYFLFSAFVPYFLVYLGMYMCGLFPLEYYYDDGFDYMEFYDAPIFYGLLAVAIVVTFLYLLAWFMSRKQRVGWLIFALALFGLDTAGMLLINGIALEYLADIILHGLVILSLVYGIYAHYKLKTLPQEKSAPLMDEDPVEDAADEGDSARDAVEDAADEGDSARDAVEDAADEGKGERES